MQRCVIIFISKLPILSRKQIKNLHCIETFIIFHNKLQKHLKSESIDLQKSTADIKSIIDIRSSFHSVCI